LKILIDENIPLVEESFAQHGEVYRYSGRSLQPESLLGVDALITRSITKVNAPLFGKAQPQFVGTCTIGVDHLDISYLEQQSIKWTSAPGCNAQSVVDYVLSVFAAFDLIDRPINQALTVGIIGCGNVGGLLRRQIQSMGWKVLVYDPFLDKSDIPELTTLERVCQSDILCLHTPYTDDGPYPTKGMVTKQLLDYLPHNACLISAGRGAVLVESDLADFMDERPDVRVVMDVWESEPRINTGLLNKVDIATPHISGYSMEGKGRGTLMVYEQFCRFFDLTSVVSMASITELFPHSVTSNLKGSDSHVSAESILSVYNPIEDMQRMRLAEKNATEAERAAGSWFDELRRSYPQRRELAFRPHL